MKKVVALIFSLSLVFSSVLFFNGNTAQAKCLHSYEPPVELMSLSYGDETDYGDETGYDDEADYDDGIVYDEAVYGEWVDEGEVLVEDSDSREGDITIECSAGNPVGWSAVRSSATFTHKKHGVKFYNKAGGRTQAAADFNKIAPSAKTVKYYKDDGSVTFVKTTSQGNVSFYRSHSGKEPTLTWNQKEKIRYK